MKYKQFLLIFLLFAPIALAVETTGTVNVVVPGNSTNGGNGDTTTGDGSTSGGFCQPEWDCAEWSECIGEIQTRICADKWNCTSNATAPNETQTCIEEVIIAPPPEKNETIIDEIVEQVEAIKEIVIENWQYTAFVLSVLVFVTIYFYITHRRKKNGLETDDAGLP